MAPEPYVAWLATLSDQSPEWTRDRLRSLKRVRPIVRHHHERLDGSGSPDGFHGGEIPLLAQIMGIVDLFDGDDDHPTL